MVAPSTSKATLLLLYLKPPQVFRSHTTKLVQSTSTCQLHTPKMSVACVEISTTSKETTSKSLMVQKLKMLQLWLEAGRLGTPPPPAKLLQYLIFVTHWRRQSMLVSSTVEASSPEVGPSQSAFQFWECRATSGAVWSTCARLMVTQQCYVRSCASTPISARRLELL